MSDLAFLFDLDATLTKREIFPYIAEKTGLSEKFSTQNEVSPNGQLPFKQSFLKKVELFKNISVSQISDLISQIELNEKIIDFIQNNKERCFIVTGHLDVWVKKLIKNIGMHNNFFSSKAVVADDAIQGILSVIDKKSIIDQIITPYVAIGDGGNDADMIEFAKIGIGYGAVHEIAPSILTCATHLAYSEEKLADFLGHIV